MQFRIALGEIAVSCSYLSHLLFSAGGDRHAGADRIVIARATHQLQLNPVSARATVEQNGWLIVQVVDD